MNSTAKPLSFNALFRAFRFNFDKAILFFLAAETLTRAFLLIYSGGDNASFMDVMKLFACGFIFDVIVLSFFLVVGSLYLVFIPLSKQNAGFDKHFKRFVFALFAFTILFKSVSEVVFWEEFSARFNFIAVDYLIYTTEVIRNIKESYNLPLLFSGIFGALVAIIAFSIHWDRGKTAPSALPLKERILMVIAVSIASGSLYALAPKSFISSSFSSQIHRELAQNGIFSLFSAFFENSLSYDQFYLTEKDLESKNIKPFHPSSLDTPSYSTEDTFSSTKNSVSNAPAPQIPSSQRQPYNVILVLMESMSAEFMEAFGNKENLTPCLDALSKKSLFFTRLYATGTRTVRGIEALTLATPPSPGQSIVKRPHNENLKSIGFTFKEHGYTTEFIYGGNSYFDNMGYFFTHNGFDVVDHAHFSKEEISFENAWGICDEDLFKKTIAQADKAFSANKPFMLFALTTSNHRPYTYPEGKIDLAPKVTGRSGGVKYADYAVGQLIELSRSKPWFDHTIFVFVADHTHGTTGRLEITPEKHHIPCIMYAPKLISPKKIDTMTSQIDIPATLFGLLNIPFESNVAMDILKNPAHRAFISNFQKLGYLENDILTVLKPVKDYSIYDKDTRIDNSATSPYTNQIAKAVFYFRKASHWKENLSR